MPKTAEEPTVSQPLPAGTYWVGDPCYAFEDHAVWMALLESADYTGPHRILEAEVEVDGFGKVAERGYNEPVRREVFAASGTAFGDGQYDGSDGNLYPVDAGLLGIVRARKGEATPRGMVEVTFEEPVTVSYEDGTVVIEGGKVIRIETDPKFYCDNYWCQTEIEQWQDYCDSCAEEEEEDE